MVRRKMRVKVKNIHEAITKIVRLKGTTETVRSGGTMMKRDITKIEIVNIETGTTRKEIGTEINTETGNEQGTTNTKRTEEGDHVLEVARLQEKITGEDHERQIEATNKVTREGMIETTVNRHNQRNPVNTFNSFHS